jgi:two-component system, chemotaxis family, CheB/CheR fusion protein
MNDSKNKSRKKRTADPIPEGTPSPKEVTSPAANSPSFPIVGIGSSAGGLEALDLFLANVPRDNGMAFIIVQHLDPTHKDMMVELLQRVTPMKVTQVTEGTRVKPDWVYVIPPNKDMSLLHGVLHLLDPIAQRGLRLPIDYFFRSLADDLQDQSLGVILSGMGSDGTLGLRAIKEKAGVTFVQEPSSAKFDSMPRSAIDAGLADFIAPAVDLPGKINAYLAHEPQLIKSGKTVEDKTQTEVEKILILLRSQTGHDFSQYKKTTVYRRIERRMGIHQISKIANYVRLLQDNPQEVELLFKELLIGVTNFFRNPESWEHLKTEILSELLEKGNQNQVIRAWVPACSTGEEAYSLAILFKETIESEQKNKVPKNITLQIFATDLDQQAIEIAREGIYPANIAADVSEDRLDKYFNKLDHGYQVVKAVRNMVIFAPQNIIMDPPFTKLDLICCRNLLIYLEPELQKKIIPLFHYSLNPNGFLFLGSAETIGEFSHLFEKVPGKSRLFQRLDSTLQAETVEFPHLFRSQDRTLQSPTQTPVNIQTLAEQILLQSYAPAAVMTNNKGDILFINGRTGKYLEPAAGKANWNIFAMSREGLRYNLSAAFQKARQQKETIILQNISIERESGTQLVDVIIQPILEPESLAGIYMIVFNDVPAALRSELANQSDRPATLPDYVVEQERELEHTRQELQAMREEMRTTQEELISTNEELLSTNEELQSTNEELVTSKEEMQSMNEELQTINQELQVKVNDYEIINNDMKNLLDSTDIATLFLDDELRVRRFTSKMGKITRLIPGDVGRPITDISSRLLYPQLTDDTQEVLRTLQKVEREIPTESGNWYRARILPYRTFDDEVDGVVITFINISNFKNIEAQLQSAEERLNHLPKYKN